MSIKTISREAFYERGAKLGIKPLPLDHRFRSDGPSIIFSSRTRKQPEPKDTDSIQKGSATPKKK